MSGSYHEQLLNEGYVVLCVLGGRARAAGGDERRETPLRVLTSALLEITEDATDLPLEAMRIVPAEVAFKGEGVKIPGEESAHVLYVKRAFVKPTAPIDTYLDVEDKVTGEILHRPAFAKES